MRIIPHTHNLKPLSTLFLHRSCISQSQYILIYSNPIEHICSLKAMVTGGSLGSSFNSWCKNIILYHDDRKLCWWNVGLNCQKSAKLAWKIETLVNSTWLYDSRDSYKSTWFGLWIVYYLYGCEGRFICHQVCVRGKIEPEAIWKISVLYLYFISEPI